MPHPRPYNMMMFLDNRVRTVSDIGKIIRDARKRAGLTQEQLATGLGSSRQRLAELEGGKPGVSLEFALSVLRELGLDIQISPKFAPSGPSITSCGSG